MPLGAGEKWALRSLMPTWDKVGRRRKEEVDNGRLKVTPQRLWPSVWSGSPLPHHQSPTFASLALKSLEINLYVYLLICFPFKWLSPFPFLPTEYSLHERKRLTCFTAKPSPLCKQHSLTRSQPCVSEQPEREILGVATFFLAPFIRCFLFIFLIVLFIFLIDMFNHCRLPWFFSFGRRQAISFL